MKTTNDTNRAAKANCDPFTCYTFCTGHPAPLLSRTVAASRRDRLDNRADDARCAACPLCGGDGGFLGALGNRFHFRCVACGMNFSL